MKLTTFDKKLEKEIIEFVNKTEKYLSEIKKDLTFTRGGCYLFARMMKKKLKEYNPTYSSVGRTEIIENGVPVAEVIDHIVVKIHKDKDLYIDASGVYTKEQLIERWTTKEGIPEAVIIDEISEDKIDKKIYSFKNTRVEKKMKEEIKKRKRREKKIKRNI